MHNAVDNMDGSSDEHHVVVGRMEMGPEGLRLLEDNNGNRILYGEKVIVDEEDEREEEEEEDEEDGGGGGLGGPGVVDHHHHRHGSSNNAHKLQFVQHLGYQEQHQQIENHNSIDGGGEEQQQQQPHHHNGDAGYGVGGRPLHHQQQQEDGEDDVEEPKLGELGRAMLMVDGVNNKVGEDGRDRPASDVDVGTAQSPHPGSGGGGGAGAGGSGGKSGRGGGKTSREPPIEWSEGATSVLLQAFGEKYRALDRGNFTSKIWADIAARVNAYAMTVVDSGSVGEGPPKTQEQCRIKVDNLKKRYKVEREKKRVSGSTISKWPFFDTMEELIGSNPRLMRGVGGLDLPLLALENSVQPLAIRSSLQEGERIYYLEASAGGDGDQASETVPKISPMFERGKRKRALKDIERENVNAPSLRALFEGYNIPSIIIDAMVQEDMDENTLINTKDISALIDQLRIKHRLHIKLGPAERIKQAIEAAREKKQAA